MRKEFFEYKLIRHILEDCPETWEILSTYFGRECLKRPSFKIQTLEMACILFGVDQKRLLQEFEKTEH